MCQPEDKLGYMLLRPVLLCKSSHHLLPTPCSFRDDCESSQHLRTRLGDAAQLATHKVLHQPLFLILVHCCQNNSAEEASITSVP